MILKLSLAAVAVLVALFLVRLALLGAESRRAGAAPTAGAVATCPEAPNCVSSREPRPQRRVEPLAPPGPPAEALAAARAAIAGMPRARVVEERDDYLRAEFRSLLFGFVDDLELELDAATGRLEVRSASRVGHSDLGANRRRVEELRRRLTEDG